MDRNNRPEHLADVGGVDDGRVEVGVVADARRQVHIGVALRHQGAVDGRQLVVAGRQQPLQRPPGLGPRIRSQAHELVQCRLYRTPKPS